MDSVTSIIDQMIDLLRNSEHRGSYELQEALEELELLRKCEVPITSDGLTESILLLAARNQMVSAAIQIAYLLTPLKILRECRLCAIQFMPPRISRALVTSA